MKTINTLLLSALVALSVSVLPATALAEAGDGRISYSPHDAIDLVLGKIKEAQAAVTAGANSNDVYKIIKQGMDYSKEVNANDAVDRERSRANEILKVARTMAKTNKMQGIGEQLEKAAQAFAELKGYI